MGDERHRSDANRFELLLRSMNPGAKLLAVLLLGLAAMVFPGPALGGVLVVLLFVVAIASGSLPGFARVMFGFGIPITVMLLFIQGCYSPENRTFILDLGFARVGLEGVMIALKTVSTLLVFLGGFYHMNRTATPSELVADLTERGLPSKAGYLVLASLNVVPQMKRRMSTIQEAQVARGLDIGGGVMSRLRATVPLLGPVVMSSLTDAEERSMTLETHGFHLNSARHTSYVEVRHSKVDGPVVMVALALVIISALALVARGFGLVTL